MKRQKQRPREAARVQGTKEVLGGSWRCGGHRLEAELERCVSVRKCWQEAEFDRCVSVEDKVLHVYGPWMPLDRGKVEVRCRTGSAAEATRPVLVDWIKDRISEQTVNIPVPRIIGHRGRCAGHTTRAPDPDTDFVERVKAMPQERVSDRIVEQLVEHPVTRCGHEIVDVVQVLRRIVEVATLAPQERVQRWVPEHIVAVPGPRIFKGNVEVASVVLHVRISERICRHLVGSPFSTSGRAVSRTFCCCASASEFERNC